jgi:membrane protease subunit (stomatin/prohibitin family)
MVAAGMVCLAAGGVMTKFGYMGRVARYVAQEIAPVATDTVGFVVDETKDEMQTAAKAISQGIAEGQQPQADDEARSDAVCPKCGTAAKDGAKFCSQCGAAVESACPQCGRNVSSADRFCPSCGKPLA